MQYVTTNAVRNPVPRLNTIFSRRRVAVGCGHHSKATSTGQREQRAAAIVRFINCPVMSTRNSRKKTANARPGSQRPRRKKRVTNNGFDDCRTLSVRRRPAVAVVVVFSYQPTTPPLSVQCRMMRACVCWLYAATLDISTCSSVCVLCRVGGRRRGPLKMPLKIIRTLHVFVSRRVNNFSIFQ